MPLSNGNNGVEKQAEPSYNNNVPSYVTYPGMSDEVRKIVEEYSTKIGDIAYKMTASPDERSLAIEQDATIKVDPLIEDIRREAIIAEIRRSVGGIVVLCIQCVKCIQMTV